MNTERYKIVSLSSEPVEVDPSTIISLDTSDELDEKHVQCFEVSIKNGEKMPPLVMSNWNTLVEGINQHGALSRGVEKIRVVNVQPLMEVI